MLATIVNMTSGDLGAISPLLLLSAGVLVAMLLDSFAGLKHPSTWFTPLVLIAAAIAQVSLLDERGRFFSGFYELRRGSGQMNLLFLLIALVTWALSLRYLREKRPFQGEYHLLILLACAGVVLLTGAGHFLTAFLGLELLSMSLYVLTAWRRERKAAVEAGLKYFLLGTFAAAILLYGGALLFACHPSLLFLRAQDLELANGATELRDLGLFMILAAMLFKISAAPFHMWTPDVYEGAPTPVTALMATGTKAAAFAFLIVLLPLVPAYALPVFAAVALLTMLTGNAGALLQTNVKRLLAYSSIAHAGYMLVGICAALNGVPGEGEQAVYLYLVAYAVTNLAAFGLLSYLESRTGRELGLREIGGLAARYPWSAAGITLAMFSLAGIPPTAGFFGKYYLFAAALHADLGWLALAGVLLSVISLGYYLRVVSALYMDPAVEEAPGAEFPAGKARGPARILEGTAFVFSTAAIALVGLFPSTVAGWFY